MQDGKPAVGGPGKSAVGGPGKPCSRRPSSPSRETPSHRHMEAFTAEQRDEDGGFDCDRVGFGFTSGDVRRISTADVRIIGTQVKIRWTIRKDVSNTGVTSTAEMGVFTSAITGLYNLAKSSTTIAGDQGHRQGSADRIYSPLTTEGGSSVGVAPGSYPRDSAYVLPCMQQCRASYVTRQTLYSNNS